MQSSPTDGSSSPPSLDHYQELLAEVYDWMQGGWESKVDQNRQLFQRLGVEASPSAAALDLGAGTGYQAVPLAELGFDVSAIDASATMLAQIPTEEPLAGSISTVTADIIEFEHHVDEPVALITCMGDTISHLASHADLSSLLQAVASALEAGGRLILSFRDTTETLGGDQRFIPVRSDPNRVFTCFLEEIDEAHLRVHDIVHTRDGDGFSQRVSSYTKIRISTPWLLDHLTAAGFAAIAVSVDGGLTVIDASR